MKLYRFTIKLHSPFGSPWQSDTLFGQLCWQKVFTAGEAALQTWLEPFRSGAPPFVLSDGFPSGVLPRPLLATADERADSLDRYQRQKRQRKARWIHAADFERLRRGDDPDLEAVAEWQPVLTLHAAIDRNTQRTGGGESGGELYQTTAWYPRPPAGQQPGADALLDLYARATDAGLDELRQLLQDLSKVGYGRDKSVGLGQFTVGAVEDMSAWDTLPSASGFISLSSYVPAPYDPAHGRWRLRVKLGKLGETLALSEHPFKRPLLQLEPGAAFRTTGHPRPWYGTVVTGIAPAHPQVVQNCQTVAVPAVFH